MAPIDIVISIIDSERFELLEKARKAIKEGSADAYSEGGYLALSNLKNKLEGFKKLFN